jgi:hypothetical protein
MKSDAGTTTYSIEVSGWNIDAEFFVERAQLRWDGDGDKFVTLRSAVRNGSSLSVRTINASGTVGPLLMAYRAEFAADQNSSDEKHLSVRLVPYRRSNSLNAPRNLSLDSFAGVHTT